MWIIRLVLGSGCEVYGRVGGLLKVVLFMTAKGFTTLQFEDALQFKDALRVQWLCSFCLGWQPCSKSGRMSYLRT